MKSFIKKILVSEKSFQKTTEGKYTFIVDKKIDKHSITKACEDLFKIKVLKVNTMNYQGKSKNVRRVPGKRSDYKKVILTLKPGDKIELFETEKPDKNKKKKKDK